MATEQEQIDAAQEKAKQDSLNAGTTSGVFGNNAGQSGSLAQVQDAIDTAHRAGAKAGNAAQTDLAGVNTSDATTSAGGIAGFFGAQKDVAQYTARHVGDTTTAGNQQKINDRIAGIDTRPTQTMGAATINQTPQGQFRQGQVNLADALTKSMNGQGPSLALETLKSGTDRGMKQALALQASARGVSPALAAKNAANAQAQIVQNASSDAAQVRIQEQIQARQQLAGVLDASRGADIGLATSQAGLTQDANKTNLLSDVDQQKQKDQLVQQFLAMGMSADQAAHQAEVQQQQFNAGLLAQQEAAREGVAIQNQAQGMQTVGSVAGAIGTAISDKRVKKNVSDGTEETLKFLRALRPKGFEYKDEKFGRGHHLGVMAQDVERGAPDLVIDDTDGVKKLDIRKALSASLASLGSINSRLDELESKRARG